jgi:carboxyl-terminal processing protease
MAAALQDAGRAILLGQRTAGYGMIQTLLRMPDDGYLHLTWAEFVAPSGYHLDQRGVLPNICTADAGLPIEQIIGQLETGERLIDRSTRTMAIDRADTKALTSFSKICASDLTRDSLELELAKALINRPNLLSLARAK